MIHDRKSTLNTNMMLVWPLLLCVCVFGSVCVAAGERRGQRGQAIAPPHTHHCRGGSHTTNSRGESYGSKRKGEDGIGPLHACVPFVSCSGCAGAEGGEDSGRTEARSRLRCCCHTHTPHSRTPHPYRQHHRHPTELAAWLFRLQTCIPWVRGGAGGGLGRQRGARERRTGSNDSDEAEGGVPTSNGACGRVVPRCQLRSLRGIRARVLLLASAEPLRAQLQQLRERQTEGRRGRKGSEDVGTSSVESGGGVRTRRSDFGVETKKKSISRRVRRFGGGRGNCHSKPDRGEGKRGKGEGSSKVAQKTRGGAGRKVRKWQE